MKTMQSEQKAVSAGNGGGGFFQNQNLPDWLCRSEDYDPSTDRDGFFQRTILKLTGLLTQFHSGPERETRIGSAPVRLAGTLYLIVLISLSRNLFFILCAAAYGLIRAAVLPAAALKRVIGGASAAAAMTLLFMLPAVFLGNPQTMLTVGIKVFLSVLLILTTSALLRWNSMTRALTFFRIPDLLILTIDLTLQYIQLLGKTALETAQALKLRSVGKNRTKRKSFAGISGVTALRAKEYAREVYQAMICRGFEGDYHVRRKSVLRPSDLLLVLFYAAAGAGYFLTRR